MRDSKESHIFRYKTMRNGGDVAWVWYWLAKITKFSQTINLFSVFFFHFFDLELMFKIHNHHFQCSIFVACDYLLVICGWISSQKCPAIYSIMQKNCEDYLFIFQFKCQKRRIYSTYDCFYVSTKNANKIFKTDKVTRQFVWRFKESAALSNFYKKTQYYL